MIYPRRCLNHKCCHSFDVVRPASESADPVECPECGHETERVFTSNIHIVGASVQNAEYNPGLGCVVKNKQERAEIAKQKGLVEVGNESTNTLHRETVVKREKEKAREWENL